MTELPQFRLIKLLDVVLDGSATDTQCKEFSRLVEQHVELRGMVVEQLRIHSLLQWHQLDNLQTLPPAALDGPEMELSSAPRRYWRSIAVGSFAAAAILLIVSLWSWHFGRHTTSGTDVLATVISQKDVRWMGSTTALHKGGQISAGTLEIGAGDLMIEFQSGVKLWTGGSAVLEIASDNLVRLKRGQATARVPHWARGFTIETSGVKVVDLGTEFGVAAGDHDTTDVVVFEGEVDLKLVSSELPAFKRRLIQGEAARISSQGEMQRIFQVRRDATGSRWWIGAPPDDDCVIRAVWDNLGASKSASYYQVVPHGFGEDRLAYVDHPHEWNGLTHDGLPEFLVGADYVRTVNDYRYRKDLVIHVEIAHDAMLYVFLDNRVKVPKWLKEGYTDTGYDIGLDETAWLGNPDFSTAVGPGESIDNTFSVWQRPCSRDEVLTLGPLEFGSEARAMYGLAAVPRERAASH
jgi:ferric-dicitrate binding protein FerR (iron transport regulator)